MPLALPDAVPWAAAVVLLLGLSSGATLTLMDRIDEHRVIERRRTFWAYVAGVATAGLMALSIHLVPVLYVLLLGMCLEWVVKNKIDYPSHVFFLFLLTLYFGHRLDLLVAWWPALVLFLAVRWASGSWLRQRYGHRWPLLRWYYASYCEKFVCHVVLAIALGSVWLPVYAIGFTVACLYVKKWLPEPMA